MRRIITTTVVSFAALLGVIALSAAPALAAAPETPETGKANPATITATTATLEGGVLNPHATGEVGEYEYRFRVSATECEGESATAPGVAAGGEKEAVPPVELTNLQPNATYTFCLIERNLGGEYSLPSTPEHFMTKPAPPTIVSESAPAPKATEATLHATINPENQETKYQFEYSTTKAVGNLTGTIVKVPATAGTIPAAFEEHGVEAPTEALLPGTVYFYRVTAENATGEKAAPGKVESFLTGPPEAPVEAKVKASSTTASSVEVEGVLNPVKAGEPGSTYEFIYNETSSGGCAGGKAAPEPAGVAQGHAKEHESQKIEGLKPNTEYTFCLIATNAAGEKTSATAEPVTFSTHAAAPVISGESATNVTQSTATIVAKVNPEGLDTHVYVEYGAGQVTAPVDIGPVVGEQEVSFALKGLAANTAYPFHVVALNDDGTVAGTENKSFKTLEPPPAPGTKPWWHITAEPVPTYLHSGVARDEVQEILATPGEFFGKKGALFVLSLNKILVGRFGTEELGKIVHEATAANVQAALEGEEFYGHDNVEVTEEPPALLGGVALRVTSKGADADRPVPSLEVEETRVGPASAKVLTKGRADGEIRVTATNLGDASASGETEPITLSDVVPAGFEAIAVSGFAFEGILAHKTPLSCSMAGENGVAAPACSFAGSVPPYTSLTLSLQVDVAGAHEGQADRASVSGGGARPLPLSREIPLGETTPFGISDYELVNEDEGGGSDTQAGSHPFQQTTTLIMNQILDQRNGLIEPAVLPKDLHFAWPAGLVGNPASLPQCPLTDFDVVGVTCPADTAVGVAKALVTFNQGNGPEVFAEDESLFNLVPAPGEPARFGFVASGVPVYIDPSVRSGRDYGITVSSNNISELAGFRSVEVSVWGSPGAAIHDQLRGQQCVDATTRGVGSCSPTPIEHGQAFLSLPTSCPVNQTTGRPEPLVSTVTGDSWLERKPTDEQPQLAEYVMSAMDGCDALPFKPSIVVTPDGHEASKPTGLNVDVHIPQQETLNPEGLAEADPKDITVTLPEGVAVNPSSGDGLQACSEALVGFMGSQELFKGSEPGVLTPTFKGFLPESIAAKTAIEAGEAPGGEGALEPGLNFCANASKIGEVTIKTPLLPPTQPLTGSVYLATQNQNPFGSLIALYLIAEDPVSGTLVRIAGQTHLSPTGQLTTTFEDSPQAPFEDAELHFFGGERAPLATPARCAAYTTSASLTPWTGGPPVAAYSTFDITEGPNHSPCPGASLPFSPSFTGGMTNINAGSFSPLTTTIGRPDGQQNLQSVALHMPPGFAGLLSNVKLCPEAQANEGLCGPESLIGETIVSAGVGADPVSVTGGKVYLTEHYAGAPFGLSIVNPVKAGPFDLEHDTSNPSQNSACDCVVVRAKIEVNPVTAEETITTDPSGPHAIPHLIDGIPVQIKAVNVLINREHFTFNPTNCNPMSLTGSIASDEGASTPLSVPFQVTNCALLKYEPKVAVSTAGKASKANGASLSFKISYPKNALGSQSWMKEMKFDIPKQLPARLTTIQKACLAATFETNRSACPAASIIGHVLVHTPVLPVPLEGPLYFVSYGGAAFPDAVAVIKGYGVTIESHGHTFINHKTGVTSATFEAVPDVPFESIEVSVPQGPFSEFGANLPHEGYNFCGQKLAMPILFKAQNGLEIHQSIPMAITGCHTLTNKQKLAAALKACHKKHNKSKRHACEKAARKTYGAKTSKKKR